MGGGVRRAARSAGVRASVVLGVLAASATAACSGDASPASEDYGQKRAKASAIVTDPSRALYLPGQAPTPLPQSRFAREDGFFAVGPYDDRQLSTEQQVMNPVRDPRWPASIRCMQATGLGLAIREPERATQAEIDALVAEVNASGPSYVWCPRGPLYQPTPAGDACLNCEHHLYFEARPPATP